MKTKNLFVLLMVLMLSAPAAFCATAKSEAKVENSMTAEESSLLTKRVEEIRDMDKSAMSSKEKSELKKELKDTKDNIRRNGGYVYIGTGTLILIILLIILL
jgi:CHASE3 domain sensor protein